MVPDSLLDRLQNMPVAVLSDALDALGLPSTILDPGIRRFCGTQLVGRARTVARMPAPPNVTQADIDASLVTGSHQVIDSASARDVVIISAQGDVGAALIGDNMATRAVSRGVVGFIVDGAIRDVEEIAALGLRVYARATSPRQAFQRLVTLSINKEIVCGSVRIQPGDVIVGDADGIAVLAQERAAEIVEKAEAIEQVESTIKRFIKDGNTLVESIRRFKQP